MSNRPPTPFADQEEMAMLIPSSTDIDMTDEDSPMIASADTTVTEEQDDVELDGIDTEEALDNLDEFDNLTQLKLLKTEINHIIIHNTTPQEGWFDERFKHIRMYSQIGWSDLASKFHGKDEYIHDTAIKIMRLCDELLEECSTKPNFHLKTYYILISEICNIWRYYFAMYCNKEQTDDIANLIEGMTNLWR